MTQTSGSAYVSDDYYCASANHDTTMAPPPTTWLVHDALWDAFGDAGTTNGGFAACARLDVRVLCEGTPSASASPTPTPTGTPTPTATATPSPSGTPLPNAPAPASVAGPSGTVATVVGDVDNSDARVGDSASGGGTGLSSDVVLTPAQSNERSRSWWTAVAAAGPASGIAVAMAVGVVVVVVVVRRWRLAWRSRAAAVLPSTAAGAAAAEHIVRRPRRGEAAVVVDSGIVVTTVRSV